MDLQMRTLPELPFSKVEFQYTYDPEMSEIPRWFDEAAEIKDNLRHLHETVDMLRYEVHESQLVILELLRQLGVHHGL